MDAQDSFPHNPAKIDWKADTETIDSLCRLFNTPLRTALTSSLRVHVTADGIRPRFERIAFPLADGLLTVQFPDWADTEYFALNAFQLEARLVQEAPAWIADTYSAKKGGPIHPWTGLSFTSPDVSSREPPAPVTRVVIYRRIRERQHVARNFTERVAFDKAVLLETDRGHPSPLLFVDDSSIAGIMGLSTNPEEIAEVLEGCTAREIIRAE